MQPETLEKPIKQKEVADMSPSDQWDQLAFKLIQQELAPKGYSEIKRGPYRGTVQSNIPFLPKKTVQRCQNLAAQCVRSYRERVRKQVKEMADGMYGNAQAYKESIDKLPFFAIRKRKQYRQRMAEYNAKAQILNGMLNMMDKTGIAPIDSTIKYPMPSK
jgi:hypothetical protein